MPRPGRTAARGYGAEHRATRADLLAAHRDGAQCPRCGRPMYRAQGLDADHFARARALGGELPDQLAHRSCNRRAGAVLGNRLRGARRGSRGAVPGDPPGSTGGVPGQLRRGTLPTW